MAAIGHGLANFNFVKTIIKEMIRPNRLHLEHREMLSLKGEVGLCSHSHINQSKCPLNTFIPSLSPVVVAHVQARTTKLGGYVGRAGPP